MDRIITLLVETKSGEFILIKKFTKFPINIPLGLTPEVGRTQILDDLKHLKGIVNTQSTGSSEDFADYLDQIRKIKPDFGG